MKKVTLKASVSYVNEDGREGYAIKIFSEGEWNLDAFFPLVHRACASKEEEKNFVHFGIINKISELNALGYKIHFK